MREIDTKALIQLKAYRGRLTHQQYKTLRGQVLAGDADGARRGLQKILKRSRPIKDPDDGVWLQDPDRQGWTKVEARE